MITYLKIQLAKYDLGFMQHMIYDSWFRVHVIWYYDAENNVEKPVNIYI